MANKFSFRYDAPVNINYKPIIDGHKAFLINLGSCMKPELRAQFNIHVLKDGYNYSNEEIIDFWNKVKITNINNEEKREVAPSQLCCSFL